MQQVERIQGARVRSVLWLSALLAVALGGWACSSNDAGFNASGGTASGAAAGNGSAGDPKGGSSTGLGGKGALGAGGRASTAGTTSTGTTACDNGKDDDGDGLIDGFDAECAGPLDNDEATFATGIPGDNRDPKWQDCFFDGNSGAGDDGCRYSTKCLTGELSLSDPDCSVTDSCLKSCAPLAQNGCDCFGCCTVQLPNGSTLDVSQAATCSLANVGDPQACPRCTKSTQCGNPCDPCELCAGKALADLPASCSPPSGSGGAPNMGGSGGAGGSTHTCGNGEPICGPGLAPCSSAEYCSFGCCILAVR